MAVLIDFEFRNSQEPNLELVCCCFKVDNNPTQLFWLHKQDYTPLRNALVKLKDKKFVSYAATAEARSFLALGLNPLEFTWIDLYLEYRCLANQSNDIMYGPQLIDGEVKVTKPANKWDAKEDKTSDSSKMSYGLAACTFKLLGKIINTKQKEETVHKIITQTEFSEQDKIDILNYCASDLDNLNEIKNKIIEIYDSRVRSPTLSKEIFLRGEYAARSAIMEQLGYPVDVKGMEHLRDNVPKILKDLAEDINSRFKIFKWLPKENRYGKDNKEIQKQFEAYLNEHSITDYPRSDKTKALKMDKKLLEDKFQFKHNYPDNDFIAQYMRFMHTESNIKSFRDKKGKKDKFIFDKLGSDGRIRPFFGIYGSLTARSQPESSYYMMLKSSWLRSLVDPKPGRVICGIDYSSQEFLISALVSGDRKMLEAYKSGDVYLAFGKAVGAIPKDATKSSHKQLRELFKSTVLGLSYNMGYKALAIKLRRDTGDKTITDAKALELVNMFFETYSDFNEWNNANLLNYRANGHIKLPDGWYMWKDNPNWRSTNNMPIQGLGSCIMRKAVALAQDRGIDIILTLHDALYMEFNYGEWDKIDILAQSMREAFCFYFDDKESANAIRMDASVFGPNCIEGKHITPGQIKFSTTRYYVPDKGAREYQYFKQYINR